MHFEWDENKRNDNITNREVDLLYAALIFEGEVLTRIDDRKITVRLEKFQSARSAVSALSWFTQTVKERRV